MFHSRSPACKKPYGAAPAGKKVEFAAYPRREQGISRMTLWVEEDGQQAEAYPMRWFGLAGARDEYRASFTPPHAGLYWYWLTARASARAATADAARCSTAWETAFS